MGLLLLQQDSSFGDIYCRALDLSGMLCFGLYHLMEEPNLYKNRQEHLISNCTIKSEDSSCDFEVRHLFQAT